MQTPLHVAAWQDKPAVMRTLLHHAKGMGLEEVAELLATKDDTGHVSDREGVQRGVLTLS